jgi:ATP-dependent DNA ligase
MELPVMPPVAPMLAKAVPQIPDTGHVEPKWDGFRTIVFRDGDEVVLGSRNERPMTRYFPELVEAIRANTPDRCVLDGEIVLIRGDRLDFEALQLRLHPAVSRVTLLAEQTPASFVAFDLLALGDDDLTGRPFGERRAALEHALERARPPIHLTPATADLAVARRWFEQFEGAGLDGVVAKPLDATYQPDKRVMFKIKHQRTADCVVAGFRWHASGPIVGSLLLGLFDESGGLQHVGVAASFTMARRAELLDELAAYRIADGGAGAAGHPWAAWADWAHAEGRDGRPQPRRRPGAVSRWSTGKDLSWVPVRPELVAEVRYDHLEGHRFRHTAQFRRWRPDRTPAGCTYAQLERPLRYRLADVLTRDPG